MTYVILESCATAKDQSCVAVCPVDCIHPTPDDPDWDRVPQVYINPGECIDCDACVAACPVDAPRPAAELSGDEAAMIEVNAAYFAGSS